MIIRRHFHAEFEFIFTFNVYLFISQYSITATITHVKLLWLTNSIEFLQIRICLCVAHPTCCNLSVALETRIRVCMAFHTTFLDSRKFAAIHTGLTSSQEASQITLWPDCLRLTHFKQQSLNLQMWRGNENQYLPAQYFTLCNSTRYI